MKPYLILIIMLVTLVSCAAQIPTPSPIPLALPTKTLAPSPSPLPVPSATATRQPANALPTLTPTKNVPLSEKGPWLVYENQDEHFVFAVNADGTGRTVLAESKWYIKISKSNNAHLLALLTEENQYDPKLSIIKLPTGQKQIINLVSHPSLVNNPPPTSDKSSGRSYLSFPQATVVFNEFTWSPDGRHLAFVAAIDKPNPDIYLYDSNDKTVRRLTNSVIASIDLSWSPDGKWIVYQDITNDSFGCANRNVWVISTEGNDKKHLDSIFCEKILGWQDNTTFLSFAFDGSAAYTIQTTDIRSGKSTILFDGFFWDIDFDPSSGTIAYTTVIGAGLNDTRIHESGIYVIAPQQANHKLVISVPSDQIKKRIYYYPPSGRIKWNAHEKQFTFTYDIWDDKCGNSLTAFTTEGSISCTERKYFSPDKKWMITSGVTGVGLHTSDEKFIRFITGNLYASNILWRPDSTGIFLRDSTGFYTVDIPDGQRKIVDKDVNSYNFIWITARP